MKQTRRLRNLFVLLVALCFGLLLGIAGSSDNGNLAFMQILIFAAILLFLATIFFVAAVELTDKLKKESKKLHIKESDHAA